MQSSVRIFGPSMSVRIGQAMFLEPKEQLKMGRGKKTVVAKRAMLMVAAASTAVVLCGCPPTYDVETGDWVFNFSGFPIFVSFGLTLHPNGTATPYESTVGYGTLQGTWTWQSDGVNIWFYQNNNGDEFTYAGTLLSETSAYGDIYEERSRDPIGQWQAARDD